MKSLRYWLVVAFGLLLSLLAPVRGDDSTRALLSRAPFIEQRLKSLIVSVDFRNASIEEATQTLTMMSRQLDPAHQGINFLIQPEASTTAQPITLKLDKVPLSETLRYLCLLGGVRFKVVDYLVAIIPKRSFDFTLVKRTFHVDPSFVQTVSSAGAIPPVQGP